MYRSEKRRAESLAAWRHLAGDSTQAQAPCRGQGIPIKNFCFVLPGMYGWGGLRNRQAMNEPFSKAGPAGAFRSALTGEPAWSRAKH